MDVAGLRAKLESFDQGHLLAYWDELSATERESLYEDLQSIPYDEMQDIFRRTMTPQTANGNEADTPDQKMEPISDQLCASVVDTPAGSLEEYRKLALDNIAQGHVGVLLLAGTVSFFYLKTLIFGLACIIKQ